MWLEDTPIDTGAIHIDSLNKVCPGGIITSLRLLLTTAVSKIKGLVSIRGSHTRPGVTVSELRGYPLQRSAARRAPGTIFKKSYMSPTRIKSDLFQQTEFEFASDEKLGNRCYTLLALLAYEGLVRGELEGPPHLQSRVKDEM